jgi:hypothetical protein
MGVLQGFRFPPLGNLNVRVGTTGRKSPLGQILLRQLPSPHGAFSAAFASKWFCMVGFGEWVPFLGLMWFSMCCGLNCVPLNSYVEVITPSILECHCMWNKDL